MKWIGTQTIYDHVRLNKGVTLDSVSITTIQSSGESFADNDTSLMTSAAIDDRINTAVTAEDLDLTADSGTAAVDLNSQALAVTGGTGITTSATGQAVTLNVDAAQSGITSLGTLTGLILDGDKDVTPGDGAMIHVDLCTITDSNTSASGTAAKYTHVNIEAPRLFADNLDVTTTNAATLYVENAPAAGTNQTIDNAYALWVDAGLVQFDGALTVDGTITGNVTGNLTGTVGTATQGTIDHDSLANFVAAEHYRWDNDISSTATIHASNIPTLNQNTTGSSGSCTGQAATVATIAGLAPNTATTQAIQPHIESIGTDGDTLDILSDGVVISNTSSGAPLVQMSCLANDPVGPSFSLVNQRVTGGGAQNGQDGDVLGNILFTGYDDGTPSVQIYAKIYADIHDATSTEESGRLTLQVANHDGGLGSGLILTGGSADNTIDATVGLGTASVVTIPGDIDLAGDIDVDGTLETDALTVGGVAFTPSTTKQLTYYMFRADIDTTKTYVGLQEADGESTSATNKNLPILAPVAGKLLKVFLRANTNVSGNVLTWRLETRASSAATGGVPSVVGTQSGAGCTASSMTTYDFTSSLDSGDNIIDAGDAVQLSVQSDDVTANTTYYVTCLWEWDLS